MSDYSEFLDFAHHLADSAREVTLSYFRRRDLNVEKKADSSPVTIADRQTEVVLREKISATFPDHGIIGEEQSQKRAQSAYEWIIDPIDGTKNFLSGFPLYGTLICLLHNGAPVVSIIDIPAQDERFFATASTPTLYRKGNVDTIIHTNENHCLHTSVLYSTDYSMFSPSENDVVQTLRNAVSLVRYNGDCYLYGMLAAGWIDIVLEADLKIYDFLPLVLIVERAGGTMTDWRGVPLNKNSNGQVLACANQTLHQAALALVQH